MPLSRKHFMAAAAVGASALVGGAASPAPTARESVPPHFHILKPGEFDQQAVLNTLTIRKPHKQVFQDSGTLEIVPGLASLYVHMQNSINAHDFSFGFGKGSLATLGVLMGRAIVLSLDDAMWKKYEIGSAYHAAPTNTYYRAKSLKFAASPDAPDSIYQDWSAEAVLHRGGSFMVCHNAMSSVAAAFSKSRGVSPGAVLADFVRHVLPGFQIVPAGVAAVQLAQQHGWTLFALG